MFRLFMVLIRKTMKMGVPAISNSAAKMMNMIPHSSLYQAVSTVIFSAFEVNPGVDDDEIDFVRSFSPEVEEEDV